MSRQMIVRLCLVLGVALPALSQSYQSSFSAAKFDRAHAPATFNGGVEVDVASGAASISVPLGPGVGVPRGGLHYVPTMQMRTTPHFRGIVNTEWIVAWIDGDGVPHYTRQNTASLATTSSPGASLYPGHFNIAGPNAGGTVAFLPDGSSATVTGRTPDPSLVNPTTVTPLLRTFGYGTDAAVAYKLYGIYDGIPPVPMLQVSSEGSLVIGVSTSANPPRAIPVISNNIPTGSTTIDDPNARRYFPTLVLVVKGDLAYEFEYVGQSFTLYVPDANKFNPEDMSCELLYQALVVNRTRLDLSQIQYRLKSVRNRFGDAIRFSYGSNGFDYTASVFTGAMDGAPGTAAGQSLQVSLSTAALPTSPFPGLGNSGPACVSGNPVQVSYQGIPAPSFTIGAYQSFDSLPENFQAMDQAGNSIPRGMFFARNFQPANVLNNSTQESISFNYALAPQLSWGVTGATSATPAVLSSVTFPTHRVDLSWNANTFRENRFDGFYFWRGYIALGGAVPKPDFAYSVNKLVDTDLSTGVARTTTYNRALPNPDFSSPTHWLSTSFGALVTHPDGSSTYTKYVEPVQDSNGGPTRPLSEQIQTLAHLKHLAREIRHYEPGKYATGDETLAPSQSAAYKVVAMDRWDLRAVGDPAGTPLMSCAPYPTRTRTWVKETGTLLTEELADWDATNFGWKTTLKSVSQNNAPSFTSDFSILTNPTPTLATAVLGGGRTEQRAFESIPSQWLMARVIQQQGVTNQDSTGFQVPAASGSNPPTHPPTTKVFDGQYNTLKSVTIGDASGVQVATAFTYGSTGVSLSQAQSVDVSSFQLNDPVPVGIQQFQYDANGFLNFIKQKGVTWSVQQVSDVTGKPTQQTDPNGFSSGFQYDDAGRLKVIQPPGTEIATTFDYSPDFRGVTVTHGAQKQEYRYNGFGELVLERRFDGTNWFSKAYGYDAAGRKTGETTWCQGLGDDTAWSKPNLVTTITTTRTNPERTICTRKSIDGGCLTWTTYPATTVTTVQSQLYPGTLTVLDPQGRPVTITDPNGVVTQMAYGAGPYGLRKTVTVAPGTTAPTSSGTNLSRTTVFDYDSLDRLVQVTDALGQLTTYKYDSGDRILEVHQTDAKSGVEQVRRWEYNNLGWVTALVQPESGRTEYKDFTVQGKPRTTVYVGDGSGPARTLRTTFDGIGRPLSIVADDGSVNQSFSYDGKNVQGVVDPRFGSANSKLNQALANGVLRDLEYNELNGRLSKLTRSVDGQTFTQLYGYDKFYGFLNSRTYPDGKVQSLSFDNPKGLPSGTGLNGATLASFAYDSSWSLNAITWANGASSYFDYDPDQARLKRMRHMIGAQTLRDWGYVYNAAGMLMTDGEDGYAYDPLNRLTAATVRDLDPVLASTQGSNKGLYQAFDFDAFGNRKMLSTLAVTNWAAGTPAPTSPTTTALTGESRDLRSYAMNTSEIATMAATNRLPAFVGGVPTGASHDAQGNLTGIFRTLGLSSTQLLLNYDALGRVSTLSDSSNSTSQTYLHDDEGLRIKITDSKTSKVTYNVYNEARQLIATYEKIGTGSLTWKKDIVYVGTKEVAEVDSANKTWVTFVDHLGSPRLIWDGTPNPAKNTNLIEQKFMPFGEALVSPAVMASFSKGFTNHERTDDSGLIYMQARFYAPWFGRFLSPDPGNDQHFEDTQKWNIYSYCGNDPTMLIDMNGMEDGPISRFFQGVLYRTVDNATLGHVERVGSTFGNAPQAPSGVAGKLGMLFGDALGFTGGSSAAGAGYTGAVATSPTVVGAVAGAAVGTYGVAVVATSVKNTIADVKGLMTASNTVGYEGVRDPKQPESGKDFSKAQKRDYKAENAKRNGGQMKSDGDGRTLRPSQQSKKGVKHHPDEAHVDHYNPKANGGTNAGGNARVVSLEENLKKAARKPND
jgi:RHS repeat-associated protein